jgi:hypothetical protein
MSAKDVISKLSDLVESSAPEEKLQNYIERHPWIITSIHFPDPDIVISRPPLGADFFPDFAYFWHFSGGEFIQLVEIEALALEVFTGGDEFTAPFSHAVQQLADWEDWCAQHRDGIEVLIEPLSDMGLIDGLPAFTRVRTLLIAGRRQAIQANARRKKRWEKKVGEVPGREIRTWEGFLESLPMAYYEAQSGWDSIRCVRYRDQGYEEIQL